METTRPKTPLRLKFERQSEDCYVSYSIYSDGKKMVRLVLNPKSMVWYIIDAATGHVYEAGGDKINNYEVLQRSAKKALAKFIGISFDKERRKTKKSKYSLR